MTSFICGRLRRAISLSVEFPHIKVLLLEKLASEKISDCASLTVRIVTERKSLNCGTILYRSPLYQVKAVMNAVSQRRSSHEKHTVYFHS